MISKTTQPTLIICHTMLSSQNVGIVKIPFRSKVMPFLIIAYCFCSNGKEIFDWQQWYWGPIGAALLAKDLWWGNAHADYIYIFSDMASNTVDSL